MKKVAWGTSKLLWFYMQYSRDVHWDYIIDDFTDRDAFDGVPIRRSKELLSEAPGSCEVYIFAVSNSSLSAIITKLASYGLVLGEHVHLYSELFASPFAEALKSQLGWSPDFGLLRYSVAATLNSRKAVHTTVCGTWLFLEAVRNLKNTAGDVAEVGCFEGGNALNCLLSNVWSAEKRYWLFDSFEGFPAPSLHDPQAVKSGDYSTTKPYGEIIAPFQVFPEVEIVKGFVPSTFSAVPADRKFSLVFYDCDLYQPALDTFAFFWDRITPGGLILIHDYFAEPGGFQGVRQATNEFFEALGVEVMPFWQNTMAAVRKA
jgi:hypothetical protein